MAAADPPPPPLPPFRTYEEYLGSQVTARDLRYLEVSGKRDAAPRVPARPRPLSVRAGRGRLGRPTPVGKAPSVGLGPVFCEVPASVGRGWLAAVTGRY